MLSGIKKGKRKRTNGGTNNSTTAAASKKPSHHNVSSSTRDVTDEMDRAKNNNKKKNPSASANRAAAEELRKMLAGDGDTNTNAKGTTIIATATSTSDHIGGVLERLESRGKISKAFNSKEDNAESTALLMIGSNASASTSTSILQKEDFRSGSRKGKVKQAESYLHSNADKTITQMVTEERQSQMEGKMSMDEIYARNVARIGSRYKGSDFGQKGVAGRSSGADEEDYTGDGGVDMTVFTDSSERLTGAAKFAREKSRQIAKADKEMAITNKCWWWMESGSFRKHMLLGLGDHVSLILSPSHLSLVKFQCILVPIKHSQSFASNEDEIWDEVLRFQNSLRSMFKKEGKGVLFCETILPSKDLWQARLDVIPVPKNIEQDAAIYFKSALTEQAEEWGTHTKLFSTKDKGLRRTIPKGFPYFYVEWDGGGFAQIIESSSFPKDFGLDTIAGMMDLDPVRFKRKQRAKDQDRVEVLDFVSKWKEFDWTFSLDNDETEET